MKAALIGFGIQASSTPDLHMKEAKAQGFGLQYDIIDTALPEYQSKSLAELVEMARSNGFAGVNVTHPFKLDAAKLADQLVGSARELETVNTLVFDGDRLVGHNTDYVGYRSSIRRSRPATNLGHVVLFGAGGAGRSVALALVDQGVRGLTIFDKDPAKATQLFRLLKRHRPSADIRIVTDLQDIAFKTVNGIVNATPVGMAAHPGVVVDVAKLRRDTWVSDIVYLPRQTTLLKRAEMHGNPTVNGVGMAVFQAVAAFGLLTGRPANPERMLSSFEAGTPDQESALEAQPV